VVDGVDVLPQLKKRLRKEQQKDPEMGEVQAEVVEEDVSNNDYYNIF